MLHLGRRHRRFPDLVVKCAPDFGQLLILKQDEDDYADYEPQNTGAKALHEYAPDFILRKEGEETQAFEGYEAHDDRSGKTME